MTFVGINEKIYFDDNLNVGIGITNPSTNFHIDSTDGIVIPVGTSAQRVDVTGAIRYNTDNSTFEGFKGTWGSLGGVIDVDQDTYISAETSAGTDNDQLKFVTAGTERMVIDSSGNTTINSDLIVDTNLLFVDASSNLVNINGDLDIWGKARFETAASYIESGVLSLSNTLTGPVIDSTGSNIRLSPSDSYVGALVVSSNGKVGIGTDSPDKALHIVSSQDEIIRLDNTSGGESYIGYYNTETVSTPSLTIGLNSTESCLINLKDEKAMIFKTYNTERMRIKSDGNVGIGTIYPNSLLEVNGDIAFTSATIKGHMIPDTDDAYDIGSAEFKIRDMYVSDDSLWVGDTHKVSITDGKMKFRKRRVSSVPAAVTAAGGNEAGAKSHSGKSSLINMKLKHWKAYMRSLPEQSTARIKDIFRDNDDDYDEQTTANNWLENGTNTYCNLGNVGIGTNNPNKKLSVVNSTGNGTMEIRSNDEDTDTILFFGTPFSSNSVNKTAIIAEGLNTYSRSDLHFCLNNDADNNVEVSLTDSQMTIRKDGNVGIGTTTPDGELHIYNDENAQTLFKIQNPNTGSSANTLIQVSSDSCGLNLRTYSAANSKADVVEIDAFNNSGGLTIKTAGEMNFATSGNERMRIDGSGNVGIGIADPSHKLHIYGASGDNDTEPVGILLESSNADGEPGIHFKNGTTSNNLFSIGINGSVGCLGFFYGDDDGGTQQGENTLMTLNSSGNLGIGNTAPSALLHLTKTLDVGGSGMIDMLRIEWDDAGSEDTKAGDGTKISFGTSSVNNNPASVESAYIGAIRTSGAEASHDTALVFGTKENDSTDISEKMRITNDGEVGIGTTDPDYQLHIYHNEDNALLKLEIDKSNAGASMSLKSTRTNIGNVGLINFESDNTTISCITSQLRDVTNKYSDIRFWTRNTDGLTERMKIDKDGNVFYSGYLGRTAYNSGCLVGGHSNLGNSSGNTNPIFCLGSAYLPGTTDLGGNMYGIGYTHTNSSFLDTNANGYGMYVAADGDARIFLGAGANTKSYFTGGYVGFGHSNPAYHVVIHESSSEAAYLSFSNTTTGASTSDGLIVGLNNNEEAVVWLRENDNLRFATNNTERMRISNGGKVGIRTDNPQIDLAIGDSDTGFQQQGDGELAIYTNNVERVRIDNGGRVGIGTTNPQELIHIQGSSNPSIRIQNTISGPNGTHVNAEYGSIDFWSSDSNTATARIVCQQDGGGTSPDCGLRFWTNNNAGGSTCRVTIKYNGYVGIGDTTPDTHLDVVGNIHYTGSISDVSDGRYKDDQVVVDYEECYNKVKQLDLKNYNWNEEIMSELEMEVQNENGFVAQDVEVLMPDAVQQRNRMGIEDFRVVDYNKINMYLFGAFKKSQETIEELESELALIKAHLGL
jgi:hypothetical protein